MISTAQFRTTFRAILAIVVLLAALYIGFPNTITGSVTYRDEGVAVANTPHNVLNCVGAGVVCTDGGSDVLTLTVAAAAGGYVTIDDEDVALAQRTVLNFAGAGVICADDAGVQTTCTIAGGAGGEDLQGTYDLETAPALIVITDALGGIQFNGNAETVEATLTILDNVADQVGILIDNDDEVGAENSPILRFANSTAGAGDLQFDLVVTATSFEIRGDDGVADITIADAGAITLTPTTDTFFANGTGVVVGHNAQIDFGAIPEFQILGTSAPDSSMGFARFSNNAGGATLRFLKSRDATITAPPGTIVLDGDELGRIRFQADDGSDYNTNAAEISAEVDGTPGFNDMPGRLLFSTTADGASSVTERMRIDSTGAVTITSNSFTFGANAASNPTLTFDADTDETIIYDAITDNRFEISDDWFVTGDVDATTIGGITSANLVDKSAAEAITGAWDFGGATSLELPNGAAGTVDAAGEITVDTTDDQLVYFGGAERVITYHESISFTLETPADVDNWLLGKRQDAITITDIHCIVDPADAGESVVIDVQERDATADNPATVDATITCDNDGAEDDGALANGTIDAGDWWSIDIGAVTGTVTQVAVSIYFTVDRE